MRERRSMRVPAVVFVMVAAACGEVPTDDAVAIGMTTQTGGESPNPGP